MPILLDQYVCLVIITLNQSPLRPVQVPRAQSNKKMKVQPQAVRMVTVIQDTLDVFQVRDDTVLKRTKRVQGHTRRFCFDWFKCCAGPLV